ncbi:hypothetical protein MKW94_001805 [Papaver nudicaule]|uniref:VWFA domain-containing protein n=1 Tax=Papaver nudicaule TaxID=74823 RepID=A0AA41V515_PAPNU|nr:hypothetical protein [Papaver nudicaule]
MVREFHDDDEAIIIKNSQGEEEELPDLELDGGKTEAKIFNKQQAPLEESPFKVLLELEGVGSDEGRLGVDLVTILDISGSMRGPRLFKMKLAMQFLVQKLSITDRLSIVTFNRRAEKICPLRQITESSQTEIIDQVNDLAAKASTNTEAGLKLAMNILNDRSRTKNRSAAIMLMSDGMEDAESQAITVPVGEVPVYTFAFGNGSEHHEVLRGISKNSKRGTFSPVQDKDDLSVAFSTALAGLLNVSIEDLTLTVAPMNSSKLNKVYAGNYKQTNQATVMEPVTVSFRSLYDRETRKVLALLNLPKVDKRFGVQIFKVEFKYRVNGKDELESDERIINVTRTDNKQIDAERAEVLAEEKRIGIASSITEARILADKKELAEARKTLEDAGKSLTEIDAVLKAQVDHLHLLMASQATYDSEGQAFALALEATHESQRAVALPAGIPSGFETPLMEEFKKQAELHTADPEGYKIPTPEEDKKATAPPPPPVPKVVPETPSRQPEKGRALDYGQEVFGFRRFMVGLGSTIVEKIIEHDGRAR